MTRTLRSPEFTIGMVCVILALVFQVANPRFLSYANIATMLRAIAFPGLIVVGMALCLMAGMIDLSVGAIAGLAAALSAWLMMHYQFPIWAGLLVGAGLGVVVGVFNALVILKLRITAFITTIGTMYIVRGLATWVTNGMSVYPIPQELVTFGAAQPLGLSWPFLILVVTIVVVELVLANTRWGLEVRCTGSDRGIARVTEVRVDFVNISTFAILGFLSAVAGLLVMARVAAGNPTIGVGMEFQAIVACAIGGVSLFGYSGTVYGAFLGLFALQLLGTGLVEMGVSPYLQGAVVGLAMIAAVSFDVRKHEALIRWRNGAK
jgi:ribose transport system permease protein